jgi:heat shock protein HslJ
MKRLAVPCTICLLVLGVVAIVAGCGSEGGTGGQLEGVNWVLRSYEDGGTMSDLPGDVRIDALFDEGRVSGSSGVNTYSASYEISGSSLTIGPAVVTMMAGPEDVMAIEQAYLAALQRTASFAASADMLTIYDGGGMELLAYSKEEAPSLTGTTWKVTGYNNGKGGVVSAIVSSELTAVFSADGTVSGSSGVNTFSGEYALDGDQITMGPLAATEMASEDPKLMEQEAAYLAALQSASKFNIRGNRLELRREDGALAVSYETSE